MIYGYCRVSTKGQLDNNSLDAQEQEILEKYIGAKIVKEAYTATTTDRPIFGELVKQLEKGDVLVVTKLDRLARNTVEGVTIVKDLFARGVSVHVLNVGLLEDTSMGQFFLTTLLAVAELERNTLVERTQAGKAIAKTKIGFTEGRPKKFTQTQLNYAISLLETHSYKEVEQQTKISKSTLVREIRRQKALKEVADNANVYC